MAKKKKKPESKPESPPDKGEPSASSKTARLVALLVLAGALGVSAGAIAAKKLGLRDRLPGAAAAHALERGDAAALLAAAAAPRDGVDNGARGALADALLVVDFGAGGDHLDRLRALTKADAQLRRTPEVLLARALATRAGIEDPTLERDLEEQKDDAPLAARLARAAHLDAEQKLDDAWTLTEAAALEPGAPAYALSLAARMALVRGDARRAAALAERGLERAPGHGMLLALRVLASTLEPAEEPLPATDEGKESGKGKGKGSDGDDDEGDTNDKRDAEGGKGGKGSKGSKRAAPRRATAAEGQLAKALEGLSPRDAAVAAYTLQSLALSRGDEDQAEAHAKRIVPELSASAELAARQAELHLLTGKASAADEIVAAALKRAPGDADLLLARARVRALKLLPADALRGRMAPADEPMALPMPLGRLVLDAQGVGMPLRAVLDASVAPDEKFLAARRGSAAGVEGRLAIVEQVWRAELALLRGDVEAAAEAAGAARAKAPDDVDALLVDASARLLKGDREGVKSALRSAVEGASDDPRVLLASSRVAYDAEDYASARTWLKQLQAAGTKSPSAQAMNAMLAARDGDAKGAEAALKDAEAMSGDDIDVLRARLVLARMAGDLGGVRKAADRLLKIDNARSPDPLLRAWQGEALFRKGDSPRAQAVLQSVLAARPGMIDAHLAMGIALAEDRPMDAAASFAQAIQIGGDAPLVSEATRRRAAIKGAPPLAIPPKGKGR